MTTTTHSTRQPTGLPSARDYQEALQNPELCLTDPRLAGGAPQLTNLGTPRAISGNFASIFPYTDDRGQRWALKCFTRPVPDLHHRYAAIGSHLSHLQRPWQVSFEYQEQGLWVNDSYRPMLLMDWSDGAPLLEWLTRTLEDPGTARTATGSLVDLASRIAAVADDVEGRGLAHGDLQHGNILVHSDLTIQLIDYDGMYVPALDSLPAADLGHSNYQHPLRGPGDTGPGIDRFSARVIVLSLLALSHDPLLWSTVPAAGDDRILLGKADFAQPAGSSVLQQLHNHPQAHVRDIAMLLGETIAQGLRAPRPRWSELASLAPDGTQDRFAAGLTAAERGTRPTAAPPTATDGSLPSWLSTGSSAGGQRRGPGGRRADVGGTSVGPYPKPAPSASQSTRTSKPTPGGFVPAYATGQAAGPGTRPPTKNSISDLVRRYFWIPVIAAILLIGGGISIASQVDDSSSGQTAPPSPRSEAPPSMPPLSPGESPTDLSGLSTAEESAVLAAEDLLGYDMTAEDEQILLDNAYICIDEYESGLSFTQISVNNMEAFDGDSLYSDTVMIAAFTELAPRHSDDFQFWYEYT